MLPFATPDTGSIDKTAVQDEPLDDSPSMKSDKDVDHLIEQRAFMMVAGGDPQTRIDEEFCGPVGVDEAHELVTTSPGVGRLFLLGEFRTIDRVVVLIKEKSRGTFVGLVVGNKQVGAISN